jgi:ribosomal protein S18 acetylase RimI-like enzyme
MIVREFTWDDYPAVIALWLEAFGALKPEDDRAALATTLARNPGLFLVAEQAGQVVGTVLATFDGRRGYLYHVAVRKGARRGGAGRILLREIERRLWALGAQKIHLRVHVLNKNAIAFYDALGYAHDQQVLGMQLVRDA